MSELQTKAIIKLLETTTYHLVEKMLVTSPERTEIMDQLREVRESLAGSSPSEVLVE